MDHRLELAGSVDLQAAAGREKKPRVRVLAYSGGELQPDFWGRVVIDLTGLETPPSLPLLADHQASLGGIIGEGRPRIEHNQLLIDGVIAASSEGGQKVLALSRDGIELKASVGVVVMQQERIREGSVAVNGRSFQAGRDGLTVIRKSELKEVSIVAVPADPRTSVSVSASKRSVVMDGDLANEPNDPVMAERRRIAAIDAAARALNLSGEAAEQAERLRCQAIAEGWPEERFKASVLDVFRAARPMPPLSGLHGGRGVAQRDLLTAGVLRLLGAGEIAAKTLGADVAEAADKLRCGSFLDLAAFAVRQSQRFVPASKAELLQAAFSTSELSVAIGSAAEKVALTSFRESPRTWSAFAKEVTATNFHAHTGIRLAGAVSLDQVAETGELLHGTLAEETTTFKVDTYGRLLSITRQALVNDDLGVLQQIPQAFARAAARKVSDLVYEVLLANGGGFFGSAHANLLTGAGSALSVTSLGNALKALRNQTDSDGMPIDIVPTTLLVGPSLESTAREVLNSIELARFTAETADRLPTGNPWRGALRLEVEPRLESSAFAGHSATAWYVFGSSADGAVLVASLGGELAPRVEQEPEDFDFLGLRWRCYLDAGAALGDWRAAVKATGA